MITKKRAQQNLRQTKKDFGRQLFELRAEKRISISDISNELCIPIHCIERLELGTLFNFNIGEVNQLARYFNKRLKISFED